MSQRRSIEAKRLRLELGMNGNEVRNKVLLRNYAMFPNQTAVRDSDHWSADQLVATLVRFAARRGREKSSNATTVNMAWSSF